MTALDIEIFDDGAHERPSWLAELLRRWPIVACLFITAMFMAATNDPNATTNWQEVSREHVTQMSINLETGRESRQLAFPALGLWGLAMLVLPARRRLRLSPTFLFPMLVFIGWAYASVFWSRDPPFTAKRLVVFTCIALAVLGFVKRYALRDLALLAFVGGLVQTVGNVLFDRLYSPDKLGLAGYRLSGLQHPNHAGISAVLLAFGALYFFDRTKLRRFLVIFFFAIVVQLLTKSRSSMFGGIAGLVVFTALRWRGRHFAIGFIAAVLFGSATMMAASSGVLPDGWTNVIHMGRQDAETTALTGRPQIWAAALEVFGSDYGRILTGMGFDSFWTPETADYVSGRVWFRISEGHCAYFDLSLELGVIGLACYVFMLFAGLGRWSYLAWHERFTHRGGNFALAATICAFTVVHGLTESTMVDPNFCAFFLCVAIAVLALRAPTLAPVELPEAA